MTNGVITCTCGQLFGFETEQDKVHCPMCGKEFVAKDYEVIDPTPPENPVTDPPIEG